MKRYVLYVIVSLAFFSLPASASDELIESLVNTDPTSSLSSGTGAVFDATYQSQQKVMTVPDVNAPIGSGTDLPVPRSPSPYYDGLRSSLYEDSQSTHKKTDPTGVESLYGLPESSINLGSPSTLEPSSGSEVPLFSSPLDY